jgi:hypothetical protein
MAAGVSAFDFLKHGRNVRRGVGVTARGSKDVQLFPGGAARLRAPRLAEGLSDPFRHGHFLRARDALNLTQLLIVDENLQSCTHQMSMADSSRGVKAARAPPPRGKAVREARAELNELPLGAAVWNE